MASEEGSMSGAEAAAATLAGEPRRAEAETRPSAGALSQVIGYQLRWAHGLFVAHWLTQLRGSDTPLTPVQGGMLVLIDENPGLTQVELARAMRVESSTLVQSVNRLEKLGYIQRYRPPHDHRAYALHLTRLGKQAVATVYRFVPEHEAALLADLTPEERRQFLAFLQRIVARGERVMTATGEESERPAGRRGAG
jgi:DNA-binding MarR family transcriptional regulator